MSETPETSLAPLAEFLGAVGRIRFYPVRDGMVEWGRAWSTAADKEWAAVVRSDRRERSGLARRFLDRGQRDWYASSAQVGEVVEVGADNINRRGQRTEHRTYRLVLRVEERRVATWVVDEADVRAGRIPRLEPAPAAVDGRRAGLESEAAHLRARLAEIEAELAAAGGTR